MLLCISVFAAEDILTSTLEAQKTNFSTAIIAFGGIGLFL